MADELTLHDVLGAFEDRTEQTGRAFSTRVEVADQLDRPRSEVDPIIDEAIERGLLEEDPRYGHFWQLTEAGQTAHDEQLFL